MNFSMKDIVERCIMVCMIVGLIGSASSNTLIFSRAEQVASVSSFDRTIARHPFAVGIFTQEREIYAMQSLFMQPIYRQAGLAFIEINLLKNRLQPLKERYGVTQTPTLLIFKYGIPIADTQGNPVQFTGNLSEGAVRAFIDKNLGEDLQDAVKQARKERRERERSRAFMPSFGCGYPYYEGGYPYWGWGYGYYPFGGWGGGFRGSWGRGFHRR
jgi:hypothetical protein